ncbi:hypothetical protein D3C72_1956190 [compost metagenome]
MFLLFVSALVVTVVVLFVLFITWNDDISGIKSTIDCINDSTPVSSVKIEAITATITTITLVTTKVTILKFPFISFNLTGLLKQYAYILSSTYKFVNINKST